MKDYTCKCCDKKWIDKTHYDIHMNTKKNTGENRKRRTHKKPLVKWSCKLCNKDYSCKNNFKKHCMTNFTTHAVYANQELGFDIYKEGYIADGIKISDIIEQYDENKDDLDMMEYVDFGSDNFEAELNRYIDAVY